MEKRGLQVDSAHHVWVFVCVWLEPCLLPASVPELFDNDPSESEAKRSRTLSVPTQWLYYSHRRSLLNAK